MQIIRKKIVLVFLVLKDFEIKNQIRLTSGIML